MTDEAFTGEAQGLKAKLADLTAGAKDMAHGALTEAMAWTAYQWTVLALLTAIFVLVALSYGGIRTELAALKLKGGITDQDLTRIDGEIGKQMSDLKSDLMQAITGIDDKITKIGAKLDARSAPKPAAPKPAARPKPQ
jgi:hypothetical protein